MAKWEKVKLGDICDFLNGYAFKSEKYQAKGYRVIRITNVQKGKIIDEDPKFYEENIKLKKFVLKENDILISLTGNVGRVGVVADNLLPAYLNQRVGCVRINNKQVSVNYLYSYMNSDFFENKCIQSAKGIAQKNLSTEWLKEVLIPLPSLEEQKKIAERLDAVSDLLEKQKQLLAEQDNLIKSIFYDMFGDPTTNTKNWKQGKIKDVVEDIQYGLSEKADEIGEFPILRMNNISYSGEMDYSDLKYVNKKPDEKYFLKKGDILFNRTNSKDLVGKTGMYDKDDAMLYAGYLIRIRTKDDCLPIFLKTYMNLPQLKVYFREKCKSIVGMANINAKEVQSISFYLPPIELQQKFATIVEGIEAQKEKIKSSIAETQTLFASLMAKYFDEE